MVTCLFSFVFDLFISDSLCIPLLHQNYISSTWYQTSVVTGRISAKQPVSTACLPSLQISLCLHFFFLTYFNLLYGLFNSCFRPRLPCICCQQGSSDDLEELSLVLNCRLNLAGKWVLFCYPAGQFHASVHVCNTQ